MPEERGQRGTPGRAGEPAGPGSAGSPGCRCVRGDVLGELGGRGALSGPGARGRLGRFRERSGLSGLLAPHPALGGNGCGVRPLIRPRSPVRSFPGGSAVRAFPRPLGFFRPPSGALRSFPRPLGSFRKSRRRARPFPPPAGRSVFSVSARRFPCGPRRARRLLPGWRSSVGRCLPVAGLGAPVCVSDAAEV